MLDDLLAQILGEAVFSRLPASRRAQLIARVFFGLLGAGLATAGCVKFGLDRDLTDNVALQASMCALFFFLGAFCLFNIAIARPWRWPGALFVVSLVMIFVTRIVGGR